MHSFYEKEKNIKFILFEKIKNYFSDKQSSHRYREFDQVSMKRFTLLLSKSKKMLLLRPTLSANFGKSSI